MCLGGSSGYPSVGPGLTLILRSKAPALGLQKKSLAPLPCWICSLKQLLIVLLTRRRYFPVFCRRQLRRWCVPSLMVSPPTTGPMG